MTKTPQSKLSTIPPKPKSNPLDDIRRETAATKITAKQARTDGQGRTR